MATTATGHLWKDVRPVAREIAWACHCDRLRRAARVVTAIYDERLAATGLRLSQLTLLATIWDAGPGVGVVALAGRLAVEKSTVSRNAAVLVRKKLVEREYRTREAQAYLGQVLRWDQQATMQFGLEKLVSLNFPDFDPAPKGG